MYTDKIDTWRVDYAICLAAVLCSFLTGCAAAVTMYPATLQSIETNARTDRRQVRQDTLVTFNSGYERVIRKGTTWKLVGSISQGKVYASVDSAFTVEGAQIDEAYLVVARGNLAGFYLPVERSFVPLNSARVLNLWEE